MSTSGLLRSDNFLSACLIPRGPVQLTPAQSKGSLSVFLLASPFWVEAIAELGLLDCPIRQEGVVPLGG